MASAACGIRWRVEGLEGLARGTIGWPDYPHPTPSTLDFTTTRQPGYWLQPRWREVWFPDAFVGTMAQLLCALEDGTEPEISGRDNLKTMALVEACYVSAREHRAVEIGEITGERRAVLHAHGEREAALTLRGEHVVRARRHHELTRMIVGPPAGLISSSRPSSPSTRSRRPARPPPGTMVAPPAPSSRISTNSQPGWRSNRTSQRDALACLATLVRASETT